MRPAAWVSFLAVFLLTAAVGNCVATAQARPARSATPAEPLPSWVVQGDWMTTDDEALQDALDKAQVKLTEYLRSRTPPMEWPPDRTYIQQRLLNDLPANDADLGWKDAHEMIVSGHKVAVESKKIEDRDFNLGIMRRAAVRITVTPSIRKEFVDQEQAYQVKQRQERATARQGVLARVLAGLVALLAAVACYLRLEDATKGYYTTLLRLAAVAFVTIVSAGIWLLT